MKTSSQNLLIDWYRRVRIVQFCHYESAKYFEHMNYWIGMPAVFLSTLVGTSVFASLGESIDKRFQILVGLVSVLSAALSGIQTFLRFSEKAEKHRMAAARYGALRREIEEILTVGENLTKEISTPLRQDIDRLSEEAPHIPEKIWSRRKELIKEDKENFVGLFNNP
jgi:hypothetical protein